VRVALALLACSAAAVAGCSGGGGEPEERLTAEQWIAEADRICAEYEGRLDELPQPDDLEGLAAMAAAAEPIAEEGLDALRGLEPPDELEEEADEWLARTAENVRAIGDLREAAEAGDATRVQELASAGLDNEAAADRLAGALGLDECAASDR
jgi:hypothetical protein